MHDLRRTKQLKQDHNRSSWHAADMRILQKQVPHESTVDFKCLITIEMQISCSTQNHHESILFYHIWQERISNKLSNRISALIAAAAAAAFHSNTRFLLLMLHIRHTCFFTIVHGSLWFVSTNSKCFAAAKMCMWSTYQFSTDFRKAKYFQLEECWWFPASRFVKISIDKLLNSIREEESVFDLVSIRWQRMFLGLEGKHVY